MAQLGCNVPAESATLRIPDRIFSRVSNRDSIETNSSTFMVEMQETSFILTNVGPSSLVIIDELGRGTSAEEGSAICWAVCEKLLQSSCFVLLATHFHQITGMADFNPCVSNHHFLTQTGEDGVVSYSHVLVSGKSSSTELQYGLELAARTLPDTLVGRARLMVEVIKRRGEARVSGANRLDTVCLQALVEVKRILRLGLLGQERAEALEQVRQKFIEDAPSSLDEGGYSNEKGVEGEEYREESQEFGEMEGEGSDVEGRQEYGRVEEDSDTRNMEFDNENNMDCEDERVNENENFWNVNELNSGDLGVGEKNGRDEEMGEKGIE